MQNLGHFWPLESLIIIAEHEFAFNFMGRPLFEIFLELREIWRRPRQAVFLVFELENF